MERRVLLSVPQEREGWSAELDLAITHRAHAGSVLDRCAHVGPVRVQRPFYPEGRACCHVYVLHPPGGLVAGDRLTIGAHVGEQAHALLTTPAAGKVYRSPDARQAVQRQRLSAAAGARLEWLPQETIVFDRARAELDTRVDLAGDAAFIGWEILCLGRTAGQQPFAIGCCRQRLELWRAGRPLAIERTEITGGGPLQASAWGLGGQPVTATLLASPAPAAGEAIDQLRALGAQLPPEDLSAVTVLEGALVARYLGGSAERARAHFVRLWSALRPLVMGRPPCPPRVWAT
jgi:urease accessory protein